jgi:hypothetical protein
MTGGAAPVEAVPLAAATAAQIEAAEAIYLEAFPASERPPWAPLVEAVGACPGSCVYLLGGRVVAFSAVRALSVAPWSHLEFLAVSRSARSGGLGSRVWPMLTAAVAPGALLLEVENPWVPGLSAAARTERERRVRYYTRLGALQLRTGPLPIPSMDANGEPALSMLLMASPGARARADRATVRRLAAALYAESYGLPGSHPLVRGLDRRR